MSERDDEGLRIGWFLLGIGVGVAVGMLYAPKSGRDTREYISQKAAQGKDAAAAAGRDVADRSRDMYDKGRQLAEDAASLFERGRRLVRGEPDAPAGEGAGGGAPA